MSKTEERISKLDEQTIFQRVMEKVGDKIKIRNIDFHSLLRAQTISETRTPNTPDQKSASGRHNWEFNMLITAFQATERAFNELAGIPLDDTPVYNALLDMTVRSANSEDEYNRNLIVGNMYQNAKTDIPGVDRDIPVSEHLGTDDFESKVEKNRSEY